MCGRFASQLPAGLVARIVRTSNPLPNLAPNWNTAPSQSALVVRRHPETGERYLDALKWGLLPYWTKEPAKARKPINARSETAATSGMFRAALKNRRAIVPCDAFYEWRTMPDGAKEPFAIGRQDRAPVALAGIWEGFKDQQGEVTRSFAIMTTTANATMAFLHDRMPVILEPDDRRRPQHLGLERNARQHLAAAALLGALAAGFRVRPFLHAAWLDHGAALQPLQPRDLVALRRDSDIQR